MHIIYVICRMNRCAFIFLVIGWILFCNAAAPSSQTVVTRISYNAADSSSSSSSDTILVDFSGLHNIPGAKLAETLREILDSEVEEDEAAPIHIDLSSSAIKDDDFKKVVNAMLSKPMSSTNATRLQWQQTRRRLTYQLSARMNQITPGGFKYLIDNLLRGEDEAVNKTSATEDENAPTAMDVTTDASTNHTNHTQQTDSKSHCRLESLDLCWNHLHPDAGGIRDLEKSLQRLLEHPCNACPTVLRLDRCGLGPSTSRALGKGLIGRYLGPTAPSSRQKRGERKRKSDRLVESDESSYYSSRSDAPKKPLSLYLSGNSALGDVGAAAIAAAIRTICTADENATPSKPPLVLEDLDLSACSIGDTGAQAISLALECASSFLVKSSKGNDSSLDHCCVIRNLDLSHNQISDEGALAISRGLLSGVPATFPMLTRQKKGTLSNPGSTKNDLICLEELDLSDNKKIGDRGTVALGEAIARGRLQNLSLRSCAIYADGAASIGKALRALSNRMHDKHEIIRIDLSGNPLGVLRGKTKSDEGKYSASRLKSKASATATSYMNQGISFLKKGLKDVGMDVSPLLGTQSAESDDEEEKAAAEMAGLKSDDGADPSKARCGAKALANAFLEEEDGGESLPSSRKSDITCCVHLGLRHCFFDHGAADALAALLVAARRRGIDLQMDLSLNPILEEDMVQSLQGNAAFGGLLNEMAERYEDAMEAIREARRRASRATGMVSARVRAETEFKGTIHDEADGREWDTPSILSDDEQEQAEEWDSDAGKLR